MKGKYEVIVESVRLQYKFSLERNITLLKGNSATGKTTLIDMIAAYEAGGSDSGVIIRCEKKCHVLTNQNWQLNLSQMNDSIVFIDEGCSFVATDEFARLAQETDNYYVIATRTRLPNLPISVNEIYGIKNVTVKKINRYQGTKRLYSSFKQINKLKLDIIPKPDIVVVEDSRSGFEFWSELCKRFDIKCISANGKSNVFRTVVDSRASAALVVADGAAFGSEIEQLMQLKERCNITLFLPESFEWIILKSGLIPDIKAILSAPYNYIESQEFFSWEQFFTALLVEKTKGSYLKYSKSSLNSVYLQENEFAKIINVMPVIDW